MYDQLKNILSCLYPNITSKLTKGNQMAKDEHGRMDRWPTKEMTDDQLIEIIEGGYSEPCIVQATRMLVCRVVRQNRIALISGEKSTESQLTLINKIVIDVISELDRNEVLMNDMRQRGVENHNCNCLDYRIGVYDGICIARNMIKKHVKL